MCILNSLSVSNCPGKCILDTLDFCHIKTGETSVVNIAMVKIASHKDVCYQDTHLSDTL